MHAICVPEQQQQQQQLYCCDCITSLFLPPGSDVDECSERVLACHGLNEICTNTEGSFQCDCADGFTRWESVCVRRQKPGESHPTHGHALEHTMILC